MQLNNSRTYSVSGTDHRGNIKLNGGDECDAKKISVIVIEIQKVLRIYS